MQTRRAAALNALQNRSAYSDKEANVQDWTYWDRAVLLSTTMTHRLFTIPYGQGGKTKADTNWINANNLPQGQSFECFALKIFYRAMAARNTAAVQAIHDVMFNTVATIRVPGKDSLGEWLLAELMGLSIGVALTPTVAGDNIPLTLSRPSGIFPLNRKIEIGAIQTIEIELQHYTAPAAALDTDKIYIGMNGRKIGMV
jgi:hypothetical protein